MTSVYDGKTVYMRLPDQRAQSLLGGEPWARLDVAALSSQAGMDIGTVTAQFDRSDPLADIALLAGAGGKVTEVGREGP